MIKFKTDADIYVVILDNKIYDIVDGILEVEDKYIEIVKSFGFYEIKEEDIVVIKKGKK